MTYRCIVRKKKVNDMFQLFTDTDTDITPSVAAEYGYKLISMPYVIDGKEIYPYVRALSDAIRRIFRACFKRGKGYFIRSFFGGDDGYVSSHAYCLGGAV